MKIKKIVDSVVFSVWFECNQIRRKIKKIMFSFRKKDYLYLLCDPAKITFACDRRIKFLSDKNEP